VLVGSLIGQDWSKMLIAGTVLFGALFATVEYGPFNRHMITEEKKGGKFVPTTGLDGQPGPRPLGSKDTTMWHLLRPQTDPDLKVERPKDPDVPAGGEGGE
jgi:hypothetical protein